MEEEECLCVRGMSSQIVFTFPLDGSLSIQLFIRLSAGLCTRSWCVSLCVSECSDCQKEGGSRLAALGAVGGTFKPQSWGFCEWNTDVYKMAWLFALLLSPCCGKERKRNLGFDLMGEEQNDKLSRLLSSNPLPPSFPLLYPTVNRIKKVTRQITKLYTDSYTMSRGDRSESPPIVSPTATRRAGHE